MTAPMLPTDACHVHRLDIFRTEHPEWVIGPGTGYWQARMNEPRAETVVTRYTLGELLDELDMQVASPP